MSGKILKCLAVDDEPHALKMIEAYVSKVPFLTLEKATSSVWEALELLKENSIDLLFLDIQMDDLTGLQLLDIAGKTCPVILTTAYSEYALKGYEYQVVDYLLKPFSFDRFLKAVSNVRENYEKPHAQVEEEKVVENKKVSSVDSIFVKGDAKNKFHQLRFEDICFIEGLKNYVLFNCLTNKIITLQNLKDLTEKLPSDRFMRVHKSYIVNLQYIDQVDGHSILIKEKRIPIGSSYRSDFYKLIKDKGLG